MITGVCLLCGLVGFLSFPTQAADGAREGLALCLDIIVPSLFPFFVLSSLMIELGLADCLGRVLERVMRPVFNLPGVCGAAVALGFLGGYPVGARTAIALYERGLCNRLETERLLSFCNNSGPAFIFGAVGVGLFTSGRAGFLLYLAHAAASLTVGVLFRFYRYGGGASGGRAARRSAAPRTPPATRLPLAFVRSVSSSFQSVLGICAFVVFFAVAVRMLFLLGILPAAARGLGRLLAPFGLRADTAEQLLTGLLEITSGLWRLQGSAASVGGRIALAAFLLGWAGLSVHCQVLSFIGESGLRTWTYLVGKALHACFSALYAHLMIGLFGFEASVSAYLTEQIDTLARLKFHATLRPTLIAAAAVWLGFLALAWRLSARRRRYTVV
jgi:sporulation integral membrane protein YlbJ